ncbi:ATP synthase subunit s, mitochondrial [Arctopsyche grandis]|uniref:ATP synthase subunit s, mitochondrial n=1 Tax=Arctopsyche grandis TaxID=121162 RepID=UPI00406D9490
MFKIASRAQFLDTYRKNVFGSQNRYFWHWLNKMFNQVDPDRVKMIGSNGACAEWLLRNGAALRWVGAAQLSTDYNTLSFGGTKPAIAEVDASDSSISHYGFEHFKGCKQIEKIVLHNCSYIEDEAMKNFSYVDSPLKYLQISSCLNITDQGLLNLPKLDTLKELILLDLPGVNDINKCKDHLKNMLPNCKITD